MNLEEVINEKEFLSELRAVVIENVYDILAEQDTPVPTYPKDHVAGMRVPKGGSSCASCEYLADNKTDCTSIYFQKWNGSPTIPGKIDEYCSDWYEEKKEVEAASENSLAGDYKGSLWNGVRVVGFTGPEEEGLKAMLSRIPPELLYNVKEIQSAPELDAKHGRFIPDTKVMLFNPGNFQLRQRFGQGEGWIHHPELTAVHEVGHSIYDSFTSEQKQAWKALSGWKKGWSQGQAPAYVETRQGWEHETSKWTHRTGLRFPRHYAEKNPNEHFADCFTFYILGKAFQMEPAAKSFIDSLVATKVQSYPSVSIESPIKAGDTNARSSGRDSEGRKDIYQVEGNGEDIRAGSDDQGELRSGGQTEEEAIQWLEDLLAGGEGSGCDQSVAESHGTSCGPALKKSGWSPQKEREKYEKYQQGLVSGNKILGIWNASSSKAQLYKQMMTGEWNSFESLGKLIREGGNLQEHLAGIGRSGKRLDLWSIQIDKYGNQAKLVMFKATDAAKGQVGITDKVQHAALMAVQKLIGGKGLDSSISEQVLHQFTKDAGLSDMKLITGSVGSWTGSPHGSQAQYLRRVASDYYGRDWKSEYISGSSDKGKDTTAFKYNELREQALAIKALSTEYIKAAGIGYMYRGLSSITGEKIAEQINKGLPAQVPVNSLSGFSVSKKVAESFSGYGGVVVRVKINPEDVWVASGALGHMFGSFVKSEKEYLVGFKTPTITLTPEDVSTKKHKPSWAT